MLGRTYWEADWSRKTNLDNNAGTSLRAASSSGWESSLLVNIDLHTLIKIPDEKKFNSFFKTHTKQGII